jgi:hypothetical protein
MSKWFTANKLFLNLYKTNIIKFITKNLPQYPLNTGCNDDHIEAGVKTKFLGLQIDDHLNWKTHIQEIFLVTRCIHGSVLHCYWCIAGREMHAIFASDSARLMADNIWNEGK